MILCNGSTHAHRPRCVSMEGVRPCREYAGAPRRLARGAQLSAAAFGCRSGPRCSAAQVGEHEEGAAARGASAAGAVLLLLLLPAARPAGHRRLRAQRRERCAPAVVCAQRQRQ